MSLFLSFLRGSAIHSTSNSVGRANDMAELMKVKQLRPRMGNVFIELEVVSVGEPREFASAKGQGKVCNVAGKDETGEVQVSLWNEQIDQVKEGNKIRIENGWVSEYKGQLQLSTGKFGTLHIL